MEFFNLTIPAGYYVGNPEDYSKIENEGVFHFAAPNLEQAQRVLQELLGEAASTSFSFTNKVDLSSNLKEVYDKDAEFREKGLIRTDEERHLRNIVRKLRSDVGSIEVDTVAVALTKASKDVVGIRIEAHEGDRRRVIYLHDLGNFGELSHGPLVEAIEAKF